MLKTVRELVNSHPVSKRALAHVWYGSETWARAFGSGSYPGRGPVLFTTQKCASVYLKTALRLIGRAYDKKVFDYESLYWHTQDEDVGAALNRDAPILFNHKKGMYGPLREYISIPNLADRPVVLVLRDPRDVVVSAYYSRAFSHALPGGILARNQFLKLREDALKMTVDEFALYALDEYLPKYRAYGEKLLPLPNVTCLSYEAMASNVDQWAVQLLRGLGLVPNSRIVQKLQRAYNEDEPGEQQDEVVGRHRRQGKPKEYLRKLSPETIGRLEDATSAIMKKFDLWDS